MEKFWIITISIFLVSLFIVWKATIKKEREEYSERMWKIWGTRTYYWHDAIIVSSGITAAVLFLLEWGNVVTF